MNIETTEYFIWIAAGLLTTIQLLYTFIIYNAPHRRIVAERKGEQRVSKQQPGISVIIATADCEELLAKHLPLILEQEYPDSRSLLLMTTPKTAPRTYYNALANDIPIFIAPSLLTVSATSAIRNCPLCLVSRPPRRSG